MDKQAIREHVWNLLDERELARFPFPPHGRIPNFEGAQEAAERLASTEEWTRASALKINPDAPQRPVRRLALEAGKRVYMAVPRLAAERCFRLLDPAEIDDISHATTLRGSEELGVPVHPADVEAIDLVVAGSVAVDDRGSRIGKGEGYSDLEFAILREQGLVTEETTTATTIHEVQLRDDNLETGPTDVPIDLIATPERLVRTDAAAAKPAGIDWDRLPAARREEIPILEQLAPENHTG